MPFELKSRCIPNEGATDLHCMGVKGHALPRIGNELEEFVEMIGKSYGKTYTPTLLEGGAIHLTADKAAQQIPSLE